MAEEAATIITNVVRFQRDESMIEPHAQGGNEPHAQGGYLRTRRRLARVVI